MAAYLQSNEIEIERTGVSVNVANNDVARLMYYLNCVCTSIDCNHDPDIQRYTTYKNWHLLSIEERKALVVVCYTFSPDVLDDKVFFHSDALCGESSNEFYTINQVRNQVLAAESIIIAGRTRQVNKIMTYKMQWMVTYYIEPMRRLAASFNAPSQPRPLTYTPTYTPTRPSTRPSTYTAPVLRQPTRKRSSCSGWCICSCISCLVIIAVIIGILVAVLRK